ncbi:MAG: DNA/RNA nuclease SfsA [Candidatus Bathyarchaeia archaeon]
MASFVRIYGKLVNGVLKMRVTRFSALVQVDGKAFLCFLPNPGRLEELLVLNAEVILKKVKRNGRKTIYDLVGVRSGGQIVSVDSRLPNKLVFEALKNKDLPEFPEYSVIKPEHLYGHTRFDFLLSDNAESCLLEVKSCTLVKDGIAMFPDAPTKRGVRHVLELAKAKNEGYRACILFIIQRADAYMFKPNDEIDLAFGKALRQAAERGVEVYAYKSEFVEDKVVLNGKVKVVIGIENCKRP